MQSVAFNFGKTNCYMKKTKLLSFFCVVMCLLLGNVVHAQTRKISGTVADDKGAMLDGVTVMVKDSKVRTTTNANGVFSINVPNDKHVLVFSYVGLKTQEVNINGKDNIHVVLKSSSSDLNDVMVIGYGTQRKQDVNGAISTVSSKQIADIPQPSVDQMLQGRASGITITQNSGQPGAAVSVRIRGITSFSGSEPLYVIDGVAIDGNAPSQASSNYKTLGGLSPS
jgi:outer membrane receptor protein involved in Fe transport